ncbi:restriction endonuclease subunit S [Enterocloster bolteae]|uniref:restriction endonuclease subunit S n=1 Tax=Clostridia TaxID=186801 RepID=UPI001D086DA2|nr:restriction endonuclease subunit S [Enterocloster bolteae]MCH1937366.1 restriction endonuclease subunit S [Enterocloster sp. OA11]
MVKKHWIPGHLNDVIDSLVAGVSVNSGEDDTSGNFFILKTSAISKGKLNLSEKKPVLPREVARLKCSLRKENILISRMNTPELVGECAYVPCDDPQIYLPDRIWQTNFKKDVDVSAKWLNYLLSSKKYRSLIQNCATGTSNSMKNISKEQLLGLEILYPSFREQTSIAEALSDIDSLISSLQKLIEKKKAIKQGAMQELLTGKKRLPGFSGEWKKYKVGEIGVVVTGSTPPRSNRNLWGGNFPWVSARDFIGKYISSSYEHVTSEGKNYCRILPAESVLVTCIASIGLNGIAAIPLATNQQINAIVCNNDFYNEIVYYSLVYNKEKLKLMAGQTAVPIISKQQFEEFEILLPRNVLEQKAIAKVLSDMDCEIEQLEKKLAKYQQIKQGMMQELLTGRIRLVDADGKDQPQTQAVQKKQPQQAHNQHFDDAVMIAGIVNAFYSEKYPLGRKKVQKLLYLVRRKEQADISAFHKKAAGPYADEVRYKGGEPIAQKNKYILVKRNEKGSCFEKGAQMQRALAYLQDWGKQTDIDWLVSQFQYTNVNDLELFATVDMAICDLKQEGKEISVASIKNLISSNKEWIAKLKKAYFCDSEIQRAIKKCQDLFES